MKPRTIPTIPASRMLGTLAFMLAKAEERLARGEHRMDAITLALEDHSVPGRLESTCRGVWYAMTGETIRETLDRHKYLTRVRRHIHTSYGSDHIDAMEEALGWTNDNPCGSAMRSLIGAYAGYAGIIHETTSDPVPVEQMVDTLLVMVVG